MSSQDEMEKMETELLDVNLGADNPGFEEDPRKIPVLDGVLSKDVSVKTPQPQASTDRTESPLMTAKEALQDLWAYTVAHEAEDEILRRNRKNMWKKPLFGNSKSKEQKIVEQVRKDLTEDQYRKAEKKIDSILDRAGEAPDDDDVKPGTSGEGWKGCNDGKKN